MLQKGEAEGIFSVDKAISREAGFRSGVKRSVLYP